MIENNFEYYLAQHLGAKEAKRIEKVQSLWSGYGEVARYKLVQGPVDTVIVKQIDVPETLDHPRGWNGATAHQRKLRSYEVEAAWYAQAAKLCDSECRVPQVYWQDCVGDTRVIAMEDLDGNGFAERKTHPSLEELESCLRWLANFHTLFVGGKSQYPELWAVGGYWHLGTRPDEYHAMVASPLKDAAKEIDKTLNSKVYETLVHGDAKLANFCFNARGDQVAAVDFQYVGKGPGIKDVVLLLSSALDSDMCFQHEQRLLDYYFDQLCQAAKRRGVAMDSFCNLETQWRTLYSFAWADFARFLQGWCPDHWKLHEYCEAQIEKTLSLLARAC